MEIILDDTIKLSADIVDWPKTAWRSLGNITRMKGVLQASAAVEAAATSTGNFEPPVLLTVIAGICGVWFVAVLLVQAIGFVQLYRYYSSNPRPASSLSLPPNDVPHITILRPVKGVEPQLYECLAATFRQTYPQSRLKICFCVSSKSDLAYPLLQRLISDFPSFDAQILVEDEDPMLNGLEGSTTKFGPNPKIRNMSRGYREAGGDVIWTLDCNVWVGNGVAGRMIDKLCGFGPVGARSNPYKFVHQLPIVVDSIEANTVDEYQVLVNNEKAQSTSRHASHKHPPPIDSTMSRILRTGGGRLEEMFMASSHAKFYTAINTVGVAPCILGKSNMFRRSHLDYLTSTLPSRPKGIDFFSDNICEDHLIGDLLWRKEVPEEVAGEQWSKHGIVFGDMAIQPMAGMSVREYIARRVRWLRVRKYTVPAATLIEPGVESLLCSAYGAFAITILSSFHESLDILSTWLAFVLLWLSFVTAWITFDRFAYTKLHSCASVELDVLTPSFAKPRPPRPFKEWLAAWLGRELLALPVWIFAVWGGATVVWRSKTFWVGMDMKVHELKSSEDFSSKKGQETRHTHRDKDRLD